MREHDVVDSAEKNPDRQCQGCPVGRRFKPVKARKCRQVQEAEYRECDNEVSHQFPFVVTFAQRVVSSRERTALSAVRVVYLYHLVTLEIQGMQVCREYQVNPPLVCDRRTVTFACT